MTYGAENISYDLHGTSLTVLGTLKMDNSHYGINGVNNGTLYAQGSAHCGTPTPGNAVVVMNGSANVNLDSDAALNSCLPIQIAKTGGASVIQTSNYSMNNNNQDLTITSGDLYLDDYKLTINRNITNSGTLRRGANPSCGVLTYGGSYSGTAAVCP